MKEIELFPKRRNRPSGCKRRGKGRSWIEKRLKLCQDQGWLCYWCKQKMADAIFEFNRRRATIDHIVPFSKGGTNDYLNLVAACYDCNQKRGDTQKVIKLQPRF